LNQIPIQKSRETRYGKTERKNVTLTVAAVEAVQAYADRHGLYFSVALETLALMGLGQGTADSLPRLISAMLERIVRQQFNRFAKLLSLAAISAGEASYKADVLLLQTIWREARQDPEHFVQALQVRSDPDSQPDSLARQIRDEVSVQAHQEAVVRLKQPMKASSREWLEENSDETG